MFVCWLALFTRTFIDRLNIDFGELSFEKTHKTHTQRSQEACEIKARRYVTNGIGKPAVWAQIESSSLVVVVVVVLACQQHAV